MPSHLKIRVLSAFRPYFRILKTYNVENFHDKSVVGRMRQISLTFGVTVAIAAALLVVFLAIWRMIVTENLNISEFSTSIAMILCFLQMVLTVAIIMTKIRLINGTLANLQQLVDEQCQESVDSLKLFKRIEQIHTIITRVLCNGAIITVVTLFGLALMFPISYAVFRYPAPTQWRLALEIHQLIDRNIYAGFLIDWIIELIGVIWTSFTYIAVESLYIGLCLYIGGMVANLKTKIDQNTSLQPTNIRAMLVQALKFHCNITDHATSINRIMGEMTFVALLTSLIIIAFNLYALESSDLFSLQAIVGLFLMVCLLPSIFVYCFLAELITTSLYEIGGIFYDSSWYRLLAKHQIIVILPIHQSGHEFRFRCLGMVDCSLATFTSLIRTTCSYFIIIRRFK